MAEFDFENSRTLFGVQIRKSLLSPDKTDVISFLSSEAVASDGEKLALDQAFKDELFTLIKQGSGTESFVNLLNLAVTAVQNDQCSTSNLFMMMSDLFDMITLDHCDDVFHFVEERVSTWKMEVLYNAGKNYLLRMCNDLLRRLSKSQNTVFCGRIQLFLARLFPLEEKSGLNLMSQFNLENVTIYNTKPEDYDQLLKPVVDEKEAKMEVEEGEMEETSNIPIDYNLYRKFWSLQDFFRKPAQCYEKVSWRTFVNFADEVLGCFSSYKLDDMKSARRKLEQLKESSTHMYFAKYLTSEKLLDLQLSDSNFRRYVLVQFLILFQYLNSQVRFKNPNQTISDDQGTWIKESNEKVFRILRETPPDGEKFAEAIEHILNREENWNNWKNEGCASYIRKKDESKSKALPTPRSRKRSIGEDLKSSGSKIVKMGNAELTRLWNLNPDNMAACKSEKRNFLPAMEEFFEEAVEQADPSGGIEDQYKLVNNPTFAWKSLRLLSCKSPYFFAQLQGGGQQIKKLPHYLDHMIGKLAKEMQSTPADELKSDAEESTMENGNAEEETLDNKDEEEETRDEGTEPEEEEDEATPDARLTGEMRKQLAVHVCEDWKKLALQLGLQEDEIIAFEETSSDLAEQALRMLTIWTENEADKATIGCMHAALSAIGLSDLASELFSEHSCSP